MQSWLSWIGKELNFRSLHLSPLYQGCVHYDRTNYSILSGDRKTELYRADVDGLILHAGKDRVNAFMEVKRDFRG